MSRIDRRFAELGAARRTALIPFVTAGDPGPEATVPLMHTMVEAGASILELGVPFSDPIADGPVIQRASERALAHHVSLLQVLDMVREFRARDEHTPVVLMGYMNPIEVLGSSRFAEAAKKAGVDGVLVVDMPPEEAHELVRAMRANDLDPIFLLAPTTHLKRIEAITAAASGFVYYVSLKGVTGAANLDLSEVASKLREIRACTALPLGVGFGIKDAETAARIGQIADAVVVGSALVSRIEANVATPSRINDEAYTLLRDMRQAMDDARFDG
jgi:tryptophan synthase alpha chain